MISLLLFLQMGTAPFDELIAAERAFARMSVEQNTHDAFVKVLDREGILFRNGPVNGLQRLRTNPFPKEMWLKWEPLVADVSASGDLGYTTGPYESGTRGQPPTGKGYFVSIWRKDAQRGWVLQVDLGIPTPRTMPVDSAPAQLKRAVPAEPLAEQPGAARDSLMAVDRWFALLSKSSGTNRAYTQLLSANARVYRHDREPATSKAEGQRIAALEHPAVWTPEVAQVASSGDLGYTYGSFDGRTRGNYVRIWRYTKDGWRIVLDITNEWQSQ